MNYKTYIFGKLDDNNSCYGVLYQNNMGELEVHRKGSGGTEFVGQKSFIEPVIAKLQSEFPESPHTHICFFSQLPGRSNYVYVRVFPKSASDIRRVLRYQCIYLDKHELEHINHNLLSLETVMPVSVDGRGVLWPSEERQVAARNQLISQRDSHQSQHATLTSVMQDLKQGTHVFVQAKRDVNYGLFARILQRQLSNGLPVPTSFLVSSDHKDVMPKERIDPFWVGFISTDIRKPLVFSTKPQNVSARKKNPLKLVPKEQPAAPPAFKHKEVVWPRKANERPHTVRNNQQNDEASTLVKELAAWKQLGPSPQSVAQRLHSLEQKVYVRRRRMMKVLAVFIVILVAGLWFGRNSEPFQAAIEVVVNQYEKVRTGLVHTSEVEEINLPGKKTEKKGSIPPPVIPAPDDSIVDTLRTRPDSLNAVQIVPMAPLEPVALSLPDSINTLEVKAVSQPVEVPEEIEEWSGIKHQESEF